MPLDLPPGFRSDTVRVSDVDLHVVHNGLPYRGVPLPDDRPPLLCLHGFPEFWGCWADVAPLLGGDRLVVIPDQRGSGLSDAPVGVEHYASRALVGDALGLARALFGERRFDLAGHDFGASVAYALLFTAPQAVDRLVVVNGVHPVCFQEALLDDPAQAAASQYFHVLRAEGAGARAAEDDFAGVLQWLEGHAIHPWITPAVRDRYREVWFGPARLEAMFDWYRASPIVVPEPGEPVPDARLYGASTDRFRVPVPHLLVWGVDDNALLASSRARLAAFCDDLTVREVPDADHWVLHTHPAAVAAHVRDFLDR